LQILPKIGLSCGLATKAGLDFWFEPLCLLYGGCQGVWSDEGKQERGLRRDKGGIFRDEFRGGTDGPTHAMKLHEWGNPAVSTEPPRSVLEILTRRCRAN
jgi:hypothetical protein